MNNSIYVVWKSLEKRRNYIVGTLIKDNGYYFKYHEQANEAEAAGFTLLVPFKEKNIQYYNKELFPVFSTRLPDMKRPDIERILQKYNLKEYDAFELLKYGAELPIDSLKFVPVIHEVEELNGFKFYIAGARHYLGCEAKKCSTGLICDIYNKEVLFCQEPDNKYDSNAVNVQYEGKIIGYVPRYYTDVFNKALEKNIRIAGNIIKVNKDKHCDNCIEVEVKLEE